MDESRPEPAIRNLPQAGQPIVAHPETHTRDGKVFWRSDGLTWRAPLLQCGLVGWSKAYPLQPHAASRLPLLDPLNDRDLMERVRGEEPVRPEMLPQPGQPLVLSSCLGEAYWMWRGALMHGPWFEDGLLGFGPVGHVDPDTGAPEEQEEIRHAVRLLREASPQTFARLPKQSGTDHPRDIVLTGNRVVARPRGVVAGEPPLTLFAAQAHRPYRPDLAMLDVPMAAELARQVAVYPGDPNHAGADNVLVRRPEPDHQDGRVTTWSVTDDVSVIHDLALAPLHLWLRCRHNQALTEVPARRLAGALMAGVAWSDSVGRLVAEAVNGDRPRRDAVRAEVLFAESLMIERAAAS